MDNQQVWVRDQKEGFIIGKFTDMVDGDALIVPLDKKYPQRTCPLDEVYPAGEYTKDVEDNCKYTGAYAHIYLNCYSSTNLYMLLSDRIEHVYLLNKLYLDFLPGVN